MKMEGKNIKYNVLSNNKIKIQWTSESLTKNKKTWNICLAFETEH